MYYQYVSLLLSAAQQHDKQKHFLKQDYTICNNAYFNSKPIPNSIEYDIDYPIDPKEVYATSFNHGLRLTADVWHSLLENAQKIWKVLKNKSNYLATQTAHKQCPTV